MKVFVFVAVLATFVALRPLQILWLLHCAVHRTASYYFIHRDQSMAASLSSAKAHAVNWELRMLSRLHSVFDFRGYGQLVPRRSYPFAAFLLESK